MLRLGDGDLRDGVHERVADAPALVGDRRVGMKADRLGKEELPEARGDIERHKVQLDAGLLVIKARKVDEFVLEIVDKVVVLVVMLGEDDHAVALLELLNRVTVGGDKPGIVIDRHGMRVVEKQHSQRRDGVAQQIIEPAGSLRLFRPEILIGVRRHLFPVHHLPRTPDIVLSGHIQLPRDGAIHMAVVADDDAGLLRQLLRADELILRREEPYELSDHLVRPWGFLIFHFASLPSG